MKKIILSSKLISLIFSILILCFAVVSLSYATWTAPTDIPPQSNVAVILNASGTAQAKIGLLISNCGTGLDCVETNPISHAPIGLLVPHGNVGIGISPTAPIVIKFAIGDTDTGFNWVSDGVLQLYTNNVPRIHVTDTGNVGIGTTSPPGARLEVNGNASLMQNALVADFINASGVTLGEGNVVIISTLADLSVTRTTTPGDSKVVGVVVGSDSVNGSTVKVAMGGIFNVSVNQTTSRGYYLRASSTAGVATSFASPGSGDFAITLTGRTGAGLVKAMSLKVR